MLRSSNVQWKGITKGQVCTNKPLLVTGPFKNVKKTCTCMGQITGVDPSTVA